MQRDSSSLSLLGCPWGSLGLSGSLLGFSWGTFWALLGSLGSPWVFLGLSRLLLRHLLGALGLSWLPLGLSWVSLGLPGPPFGLSWGLFATILDSPGALLAPLSGLLGHSWYLFRFWFLLESLLGRFWLNFGSQNGP